ncbi:MULTISPECIES: hypothetical protein [unclassified Spiroplasma]|uniref:hypothetical protein n=1 Tax=unclassified Spiroplasma TaxID=2637901 RepID=UPI0027A2AB25|nr:MAG: hypothetical protein PPFGHCPK_00165 [Spiroplasma endosymbiont of Drosophila atripex]
MNDEDEKCDLEVKLILEKQYKNDQIKEFLVKLINSKKEENKFYSNLELLADVSLYYKKIKKTVKITNNILEIISKILKLNDTEINNFLSLSWNKIQEITTEKIINIEEINDLLNEPFVNTSYINQKNLI